MNPKHRDQTPVLIALLALAGVLFAGYLSFSKIILKQCALNESCNYIFGIPTCVIGFVLFVLILILAWMRLRARDGASAHALTRKIHWIAIVAVLFSGYYAAKDIFFPALPGLSYSLILPSCVYGFFVFVIVFLLNRKLMK